MKILDAQNKPKKQSIGAPKSALGDEQNVWGWKDRTVGYKNSQES